MKQSIERETREAVAKEGVVPMPGKAWDAGYEFSYKMEGKEGEEGKESQG